MTWNYDFLSLIGLYRDPHNGAIKRNESSFTKEHKILIVIVISTNLIYGGVPPEIFFSEIKIKLSDYFVIYCNLPMSYRVTQTYKVIRGSVANRDTGDRSRPFRYLTFLQCLTVC